VVHGALAVDHRAPGAQLGVRLEARAALPVECALRVEHTDGGVLLHVVAVHRAVARQASCGPLTNVAKHSRAGRAEVTARIEDGTVRVRVSDDGIGDARPEGSGLIGLGDRLATLDGRLHVRSPAGGGTLVAADIPLPT
jgi:nitrate/nitrite-specific signal transduction histidine kinase